MNMIDAMIPEYQHETAVMRKVLERIPDDKLGYTPHEKSMSFGKLASHIAESQGWVKPTLELDSMDIPEGYVQYEGGSSADILATFDAKVAEAVTAMQGGISNEAMMANWKLSVAGNTVFEMPRVAVMRSFVLSHLIHHRGQLSVYLRMNDIPVPAIYGPSADEQG